MIGSDHKKGEANVYFTGQRPNHRAVTRWSTSLWSHTLLGARDDVEAQVHRRSRWNYRRHSGLWTLDAKAGPGSWQRSKTHPWRLCAGLPRLPARRRQRAINDYRLQRLCWCCTGPGYWKSNQHSYRVP